MKFLLIRPPFAVEKFYFPRTINESLGIESLEAFLKPTHKIETIDTIAEGWNHYWRTSAYPEIIFQGIKPKNLIPRIIKAKPEMIGLSWLFSTQTPSIELIIKEIRKINSQVPIIVGGPCPSANPIEILTNHPEIDMVIYGEGEITLKEILDNQLNNLENIRGLAYRQNGQIKVNPPRALIENLDSLPLPCRHPQFHQNYSKIFFYQAIYSRLAKLCLGERPTMATAGQLSALPRLNKIYYLLYNAKNKKWLPSADLITSRGCPNHCTFCAIHNIWGHRWRMRSANNVLAEIELLVKKFKVKHLNFQDDNFNVSKERIITICKEIVKNNYQITLLAPSGAYVGTLDKEVLTWLKKAGMHAIRLSIESGNQDILYNVIKKNIDLNNVKAVVDVCRELKIYTEGCFIFGIPGESLETMQDSLEFAKAMGFNRTIKFIFQPFTNTELYDLCVEKGYLTPDYDPTQAYVTGSRCFVKTEKFSPADVLKIVNR